MIERKRVAGEKDGLLWYCANCNHKLYEEFFTLQNIETDFLAVFERYYGSLAARTCGVCSAVLLDGPTPVALEGVAIVVWCSAQTARPRPASPPVAPRSGRADRRRASRWPSVPN